MRSTSGQHYIGLDHLRALAAFLVVCWHFIPVSQHASDEAPIGPFAVLHEGHTGVALFMVLSGYLFAKLLDGKRMLFAPFLLNRALRLLPLLSLVLLWNAMSWTSHGGSLGDYLTLLARGLVLPTWPNGGWSIVVEAQFYLLLPLILWAAAKSPKHLVRIIVVAMLVRVGVHLLRGNVQDFAYWTLGGRIDQFVGGILAWHCRDVVRGRGRYVIAWLAAFAVGWWAFDAVGGFYTTRDSVAWVFIPTVEAMTWGGLVAWYDSLRLEDSRLSRAIAFYGDVSYSIYLLHFFWVFKVASALERAGYPMTNTYAALAAAFVFFLAMGLPGWLTGKLIERPAMRWRRPYAVAETRIDLNAKPAV
ncbi:acyltransferase [Lysobacter sp. A6]|uniref:Acyltransferase n=1 Tax=Noviluteimonas lactosilytica TaxID=2888523 RepID=A0ABS8JDL0_9GAMM|nr:acyltransferase [Lysobacter lactosilyticus]MCC8361692.1 acyltransferase [Lysobacter lactosilyticus]